MIKPLQYLGQGVVYGLFALGIGYFATSPTYTAIDPDKALIKLSFAHGGATITPCRKRTREEMKALAANMRAPNICPRQRVPLHVRLSLDGKVIAENTLPPTGLRGDGPSKTYQRFVVSAGAHTIIAELRDSRRTEGFDYKSTKEITLKPGQSLSIDFKAAQGGFIYE